MKKCFSKTDIQIANKSMKKCSISLIIREIQIKTTVRYHLTPVRMVIIKKKKTHTRITSVGGDWEKRTLVYCS